MCLGVPGKVTRRFEVNDLPMGKVDFDGATVDVCLAYVPEAGVGSYVIVHAGFAISVLDENEARQVLDDLMEIERLAGADERRGDR